ncbi:MAG: transposase [Prevotellaceae bacterium]|nr:transposase [Prevotellaceae bacterium]
MFYLSDYSKKSWLRKPIQELSDRVLTFTNKLKETGCLSFNVIAASFYEHSEEILNFYTNPSSNTSAEAFNSKIKFFWTKLREVLNIPFFLFRLSIIYP